MFHIFNLTLEATLKSSLLPDTRLLPAEKRSAVRVEKKRADRVFGGSRNKNSWNGRM